MSETGINTDPEKSEAIQKWSRLKSQRKVVYKLTNQCEEAFKTMKKAMSPSILGYPSLFLIQMPVIRQCFFKNGMDKKK